MRTRVILVVDDEPRTRQGIKRMLEVWKGDQLEVLIAASGYEALNIVESTAVDLVITDIRMPEAGGLHVARQISEMHAASRPAVILISGFAEFEYAQQAISHGVVNYLLKPIGKEKFLSAVDQAIQARDERKRLSLLAVMTDSKLLELDYAHVSEPIALALRFMDEHSDQAFGLQEVAQQAGLNASYFSALFKEQMNMNFSEYVTRRKLHKAKDLLIRTKLPVAVIAEQVGYQTTKYFHKVFKEYVGASPGTYRQQMTQEEMDT
jgi:two-component system response regulator YesN